MTEEAASASTIPPPARPDSPPRRARVRSGAGRLTLISLGLVGLAVMSFLLGQRIQTPEQALAEATPPGPTTLTVRVDERQLVDAVTFRADVVLGNSHEVDIPYSEEIPIVTEVSVEEGKAIEEGDTLLAVNGMRRIILYGQLPPYRDLAPGVSGPDVAQLQDALTRLGYQVGRPGVFDRATQRAVRTMFADRGAVLSIDEEAGGIVIEREWLVFSPDLPSRVVTSAVQLGMDLRDISPPLIALSNSPLLAVATVDAGLAAELAPGQRVEVSSGSTSIEAAVRSVEPSAQGASEATVTLEFVEAPPADWRGLNVKVDMVFERTPAAVMAIPVSGVFGDASGQAYIQRLAEDGTITRIDVEVGEVARGYVQISSADELLNVGDHVVVGQESQEPSGTDR